MSMVRRMSIAFLELAESSSIPSGQGMSKIIHNDFVKQLIHTLNNTANYIL